MNALHCQLASLLLAVLLSPQAPQTPVVSGDVSVSTSSTKLQQPASEPIIDLASVKRIYVESFGDDSVSRQIQAMVIASITESKRIVVTENPARADAILKGASTEKTSQEVHAYSDSTAAGGSAGGYSGSVSGSSLNGVGHVRGSSAGGFASRAASISDSSVNTETINDAKIAVRLVTKDGDVIWATTQESKGAKYKGASADVAERVVKQLIRDLDKARRDPNPSTGVSGVSKGS